MLQPTAVAGNGQRAVREVAVQATSRLEESEKCLPGDSPGMETYSPRWEPAPGKGASADSPGNYESLNVCCSRQVTVS